MSVNKWTLFLLTLIFPILILSLVFNSTLTDSMTIEKSTWSTPYPKGCRLIFLLSPFKVRGKKAEKSDLKLICQSRINIVRILQNGWIFDIIWICLSCITIYKQKIGEQLMRIRTNLFKICIPVIGFFVSPACSRETTGPALKQHGKDLRMRFIN